MDDANIWQYFDAIYCINLYSRQDKYVRVQDIFSKHSVPVKFYRTDRDDDDPHRGCYNSHLAVVKEAYDRGCQNVLIFEDDIAFHQFDTEKLRKCARFMQRNEYDVFFLGSAPEIVKHSVKSTEFTNIYQIYGLHAHAYVMHRNYMRKFIQNHYIYLPIDCIYLYNKRNYGILPPLVV